MTLMKSFWTDPILAAAWAAPKQVIFPLGHPIHTPPPIKVIEIALFCLVFKPALSPSVPLETSPSSGQADQGQVQGHNH